MTQVMLAIDLLTFSFPDIVYPTEVLVP